MTDHPILMKGKNVCRILDGRKTQTRRVIKPQPVRDGMFWTWKGCGWSRSDVGPPAIPCHSLATGPFGCVGHRLWVRETWQHFGNTSRKPKGDMEFGPVRALVAYSADGAVLECGGWATHTDAPEQKWWNTGRSPWQPSIFMPKWACRIWLEVLNVRVERLQEISERDAIAEGMDHTHDDPGSWQCPTCDGQGVHGAVGKSLGVTEVDCRDCDTARKMFQHSWNDINAKRGFGWDANPWVWVVGFRVTKPAPLRWR